MYRDRCAPSLMIRPARIGRARLQAGRQAVAANVMGDDCDLSFSKQAPCDAFSNRSGRWRANAPQAADGGELIGCKQVSWWGGEYGGVRGGLVGRPCSGGQCALGIGREAGVRGCGWPVM